MKDLIKELGNRVKNKEITWNGAAKIFNEEKNENLTGNALRKRFSNLKEDIIELDEKTNEEYETYHKNGTIEICKKEVWFDKNEEKTPENVLAKFGYNPELWELQTWRFGKWEVAIADEDENRVCTTIKCVIKPKVKSKLDIDEVVKISKEVFSKEIKPLKLSKQAKKPKLDDKKLLFITAIEAHLGKLSNTIDTNTTYDHKIVRDRVRKVFKETIELQEQQQCGTCLVIVGGDYFNSESNGMTTGGTPQQNDTRYKKMYQVGLDLMAEGIISLRDKFNKVDIKLEAGNHSRDMEFFLYMALQQRFNGDDVIKFSDDYKYTQNYMFGQCGLFFNHGEGNQKRLVNSIPAEFYDDYGKTKFRYLMEQHLHIREVKQEQNGLISYRTPSICETDEWHYRQRFGLGVQPLQEIIVLHKDYGITSNHFINFEDSKKKLLIKK